MRRAHRILRSTLCAVLLLLAPAAAAQTAGPPASPGTVPPASPGTVPPPLVSAARVDSLPTEGPTKSPGTAMLLSAILPGAGQVYNESYWKVPIIAGLGGYFVVEFLDNNRKYNDYSDQYEESLDTVPGGDPQLLAYREFYRDQRDTFAWYFLILYAVNILDAYVDASLFDFDVGGDLAGAAHGPPAPGASLTLRVRL